MELRRLREKRGLTQEGLANLSGVSRPAIHRIENGQQAPRRSTVSKLARALEVEPSAVAPELFPKPGSPTSGVALTPEILGGFKPYIATVARELARSAGDAEDLEGAGRESLFEACRKFRDDGGMAFEPWAKTYVRNRILDEARRHYGRTEKTDSLEDALPPEWEGDIPDMATMTDEE
jgi:transcriptional regulator with XRE-family HTH domain